MRCFYIIGSFIITRTPPPPKKKHPKHKNLQTEKDSVFSLIRTGTPKWALNGADAVQSEEGRDLSWGGSVCRSYKQVCEVQLSQDLNPNLTTSL